MRLAGGMLTSRYYMSTCSTTGAPQHRRRPYWVDFCQTTPGTGLKPPAAAPVFARDLLGLNSQQRWGRVQWRWSPRVNHFKRTDPKGPPPTTKAERLRIYGFHLAVLARLSPPVRGLTSRCCGCYR